MKTLNLTDKELPLLRFLLSVAVNELGSRRDRALDAGAVQEYADKIRGCEALQGRLNQLEQPEEDKLADAKAQGRARDLANAPVPAIAPSDYFWLRANALAEGWAAYTLDLVLTKARNEGAPADAYSWEPDRNTTGEKISAFRWQTMTELRTLAEAGNRSAKARLAKLETAYRDLGFDLQEASAGEVCGACGRPEWDCSENPCEAVQRQRQS